MKTKLISAFLLIAALFAVPAFARQSVPIINVENTIITTTSGKTPTLDQTRQSIIAAGNMLNWQFAEPEKGKLIASLAIKGKHFMTVEIPYTATQYSLLYKDSVNLNYAIVDGTPVIHPNYNKWVQNLNNAIRLEQSKL